MASAGCRKSEGQPVEARVAEIFCAMIPLLPIPVTTTRPAQPKQRLDRPVEALVEAGDELADRLRLDLQHLACGVARHGPHPSSRVRKRGPAGPLPRRRRASGSAVAAVDDEASPGAADLEARAERRLRPQPARGDDRGKDDVGDAGLVEEARPFLRRGLAVEASHRRHPRGVPGGGGVRDVRPARAEAADVEADVLRGERDLAGAARLAKARGRHPTARRGRSGPGSAWRTATSPPRPSWP